MRSAASKPPAPLARWSSAPVSPQATRPDWSRPAGRVLTVVGRGGDLADAADAAYAAAALHRLSPASSCGATSAAAFAGAGCDDRALHAAGDGRALDRTGALRAHAARRAGGTACAGRAARHGPGRQRSTRSSGRRRIDVARIAELEQTTDHDVIAFVSQVAETGRRGGPLPALRADLSDVRRHRAGAAVPGGGRPAADVSWTRLIETPRGARRASTPATVMMGRTHSVHAEPITLGLKLASWAFELARDRRRSGRGGGGPGHGQAVRRRSAPTASSVRRSRPR